MYCQTATFTKKQTINPIIHNSLKTRLMGDLLSSSSNLAFFVLLQLSLKQIMTADITNTHRHTHSPTNHEIGLLRRSLETAMPKFGWSVNEFQVNLLTILSLEIDYERLQNTKRHKKLQTCLDMKAVWYCFTFRRVITRFLGPMTHPLIKRKSLFTTP